MPMFVLDVEPLLYTNLGFGPRSISVSALGMRAALGNTLSYSLRQPQGMSTFRSLLRLLGNLKVNVPYPRRLYASQLEPTVFITLVYKHWTRAKAKDTSLVILPQDIQLHSARMTMWYKQNTPMTMCQDSLRHSSTLLFCYNHIINILSQECIGDMENTYEINKCVLSRINNLTVSSILFIANVMWKYYSRLVNSDKD